MEDFAKHPGGFAHDNKSSTSIFHLEHGHLLSLAIKFFFKFRKKDQVRKRCQS